MLKIDLVMTQDMHKILTNKGLEYTFNWYKNNLGYFKKISKKNITIRLGLKL